MKTQTWLLRRDRPHLPFAGRRWFQLMVLCKSVLIRFNFSRRTTLLYFDTTLQFIPLYMYLSRDEGIQSFTPSPPWNIERPTLASLNWNICFILGGRGVLLRKKATTKFSPIRYMYIYICIQESQTISVRGLLFYAARPSHPRNVISHQPTWRNAKAHD